MVKCIIWVCLCLIEILPLSFFKRSPLLLWSIFVRFQARGLGFTTTTPLIRMALLDCTLLCPTCTLPRASAVTVCSSLLRSDSPWLSLFWTEAIRPLTLALLTLNGSSCRSPYWRVTLCEEHKNIQGRCTCPRMEPLDMNVAMTS